MELTVNESVFDEASFVGFIIVSFIGLIKDLVNNRSIVG